MGGQHIFWWKEIYFKVIGHKKKASALEFRFIEANVIIDGRAPEFSA